jgi:disulfide bond formation protein DsbB
MEISEQIESPQNEKPRSALAYMAWVIALLATVGSLFFSEVMNLPPCVLCWYQRIAMYPLVLIVGAGIVMRDWRMKYYALPVSLSGLAVAVYHNLLYYSFIPDSITPCTQGISCTSVQIEWLGFITIPLMSLAAFISVSLCLLLYKPRK